ncbi:hypothetical protein DPMN_036854 [Dreissena polymorpha]|uniref:Uncharacterized protein n=1 Tax=Dreissena polymorpha TaxID=45954 RepID=A0A9D4RLU2_DREPO|nr:hypothetical protein DPMN_036854 [Dreissena polymorpha]
MFSLKKGHTCFQLIPKRTKTWDSIGDTRILRVRSRHQELSPWGSRNGVCPSDREVIGCHGGLVENGVCLVTGRSRFVTIG